MAISNVSSNSRPGVCTSTTRPSAPYEGQLIYETDTDMLAIWNGTAWRYIAATTPTSGTVLQVASTTKTDTFTTTSSDFTDVTGLSVSITPKSTSSKVLVMVTVQATGNTGTTNFFGRLVRDSTAIAIGDAAGGRPRSSFGSVSQEFVTSNSIIHLDSPSTTSATTYKIQIRSQSSGATVYINRNTGDLDGASNPRTASSITVMEIAG